MPYRLTTFQVNTWLQKESTNSIHKISPWLGIHVNKNVITKKKMSLPLSLSSYALGGGMLPVHENDVPYSVSQHPVEIC